jgi:hypothetical protein
MMESYTMTKKKSARVIPMRGRAKPNGKAHPDKRPTVRLISRADLLSLLKQVGAYDDRAATASGHAGELVREYAEKKFLHRGAFSVAKRLAKMAKHDSSKLWLWLAHFDHMRATMKLDDMAKAQGQMLPAISEEDDDSEETSKAADTWGNEETAPRAVEEQAGEPVA